MGGYTTVVFGQRLDEHVPAATDMHETGTVFSAWSLIKCYKKGKRLEQSHTAEERIFSKQVPAATNT
jgi:hypothetical protein